MIPPKHVDGATLESDTDVAADVVVIGTGAGGAAVARELTEAGRDVILLEEGPYVTARDYGHLSTIDATKLLYRDRGLTASQGAPPVLLPMGRCVGGTTVINLGTVLRMEPEHFAIWRENGIAKLSYADLSAAYDRVEELMPVKQVTDEQIGPNTRVLQDGLAKLSIPGEVLTRNAPECRGAGRCFLGCPTDAKRAVHLDWIPRAIERGARLFTRVCVERILVDQGRAVGIEGSVLGANERRRLAFRVRSKHVVVACGALMSPVLLHDSNLGLKHAASGANLGVHPACRATGLYDRKIQGQHGVPQAYHARVLGPGEMYVETAFLPPALMGPALPGFGPDHHKLMQKYEHFALAGFRVIETRRGSVKSHYAHLPLIKYQLGDADFASMRGGLKLSARILFETGAKQVFVPIHGMELLGSPDDISKIDDPRIEPGDLELSGYHAHGTLRMGSDPARAVVDEDGSYHGVKGLWVADASLFPTSSRVNPQHTVMALATLVGRAIVASRA